MENRKKHAAGAESGGSFRKRIGFAAACAAVGLVSGVLLGLTLKMIQGFSGHRVYRLLLNADYVPLLNRLRLGEGAEFVIHLLISAVLCVVLGWFWRSREKRKRTSAVRMAAITAAIGMLVGCLLYPTTLLSAGGTPPIDSLPSWLWWLGAHLLYGAISGLLLRACLRAAHTNVSI